jgi:antirestriction protein ArdC
MKKTITAAKPNVYQIVTDRIIASLKSGVIPWEKPWKAPTHNGDTFPRNFRTGRPYRGINVFLLWSSPYSSPFWLTFKQALDLKGNVRKGEKGTQIVFYKQLVRRDAKTLATPGEKNDRAPFVLTYHTVFNVEQCENLQIPTLEAATPLTEIETDEACEAIVNAWETRPTLHLTSETEGRAYYRPRTDAVHMPLRSRFVDAAHYYSTLFHELVHSTGHESRLSRTFGERFGDDLYSKEELVAETGAAFLCAFAGIASDRTERNTTAYIQNWIQKLEADNRLIVQAAGNAQKAVDLITGYTYTAETDEEGSAEQTGTQPVPDPAAEIEAELRAMWTAQGVPEDRQNAVLADVTAKAQPGATIGSFTLAA